MIEAAKQAMKFAANRCREDLDSDDMLRRALRDCIQEIGEAASHITDAARKRAPNLPWNKIVGMRHRMVHVYYDIDCNALWEVVSRDLQPLIAQLEDLLTDWPSEKT